MTLMTDEQMKALMNNDSLAEKLKNFDVDDAYKALKDAASAIEKVEKLLIIFSRRRAAWIHLPALNDLPSGKEMAKMLKELGID